MRWTAGRWQWGSTRWSGSSGRLHRSTGRAIDGEVIQAVADLAAIRRWCDGREVALAGFMHQHSPIPEKPMAKAARSSQRQAKKVLQRGETAGETPALGKALEKGEVSGEHVDAAGSALRSADQAETR